VKRSLAVKIGIWLSAVFILVALFGWDLLDDIEALHHEASFVEESNRQSHDLHALEMGLYACIAPIKEFLITGDYRLAERFDRQSEQLLRSVSLYQQSNNDEAAASLVSAIKRVHPKAQVIFGLPFAVGNMEGPILLHEIETEVRQVSEQLSARHHKMDAKVNSAMRMLAGLRMDIRNEAVALLSVLLVMLLLLARYMYNGIVRPLVDMRRAVQKVGVGDFEIACERSSDDELGELASAFNAMARALKEREEMLNSARSMAAHQEKMNALGMMASGIAHEVGNPLSAISVSLQVALQKLGSKDLESTHQKLQIALQEVERTENIIRQILDYSRKDDQQPKRAFSAVPVIQKAVDLARMTSRSNAIKFRTDITDRLPEVWGLDTVLMQVLVNLLLNALDACGEGGMVIVHAAPGDDGVAIDVRDNGPGIPSELQKEIFKPLFTTKPRGMGSGLGLVISRELCTRMGWELNLIHSDSEGSCFRIWLPSPAEEHVS